MGLSALVDPLRIATSRKVVALLERSLRRGAISQGPPGRAEVALTFDDGPHPEWTPQVLDILDRSGTRATFFVVGRNAAAHPQLVVEAKRRGHEIGTHLYSHERSTVLDDTRFEEELMNSRAILEPLLGEPLRWLRFPYGSAGKQRPDAVFAKFGVRAAYWTFSSHDAKASCPEDIVQRVDAGLRPGAIVLMHDALADTGPIPPPYIEARGATVQALPSIAALLSARGLRAVTLSELFRP